MRPSDEVVATVDRSGSFLSRFIRGETQDDRIRVDNVFCRDNRCHTGDFLLVDEQRKSVARNAGNLSANRRKSVSQSTCESRLSHATVLKK